MSQSVKTGGCLCGKIRYELVGDSSTPLYTTVCHCINCRRTTGSAFCTASICPKGGFKVTQGSEFLKSYTDSATDSRQPLTRQFCSDCGSKLFALTPLNENIISVAAGSLDDFEKWQPNTEQYCENRADFVERAKGVGRQRRFVRSVVGVVEGEEAQEGKL